MDQVIDWAFASQSIGELPYTKPQHALRTSPFDLVTNTCRSGCPFTSVLMNTAWVVAISGVIYANTEALYYSIIVLLIAKMQEVRSLRGTRMHSLTQKKLPEDNSLSLACNILAIV